MATRMSTRKVRGCSPVQELGPKQWWVAFGSPQCGEKKRLIIGVELLDGVEDVPTCVVVWNSSFEANLKEELLFRQSLF